MKRYVIFIILLQCCALSVIFGKDSLKTFQSEPLEVTAFKNIPTAEIMIYGTDYNSDFLNRNGNSLIRRGMNYTQDVYSDGFRRGDIKVTIDGEQYHTACPNRMDSPASRINPLEMESVEISKSSSLQGSGLYGKIDYHRRTYDDNFRLGAFLSGNTMAQQDIDASTSVSAYNQGLIIRYSTGNPYSDGSGASFKDLYNYKDDFVYNNISLSYRGKLNEFKYGVSYNSLSDLSFPYLQMDEISSNVLSGFFSYKEHKVYFNHTDHLMDNTLRNSPMFMSTDAKNTTIGLIGQYYEINFRNWNADNQISSMQGEMPMEVSNNMLPDINQIYVGLNYDYEFNPIKVTGRLSSAHISIGNNDVMNFYTALYPDSKESRFFVTGALNVMYSTDINKDIRFAANAEAALESPEAEQLFISVRRLMKSPNWSGNPILEQPLKFGFRSTFNSELFRLEGFYNYVNNYVYINSVMIGDKPYQTFDNINALIAGFNFAVKYSIFESSLSFVYGENLSSKTALSEIVPLSITNKITIPDFYGVKSWIVHKYENVQFRVDETLREVPTEAWNTLGIGLMYNLNSFWIRLDVDNLFDHKYSRYLSFARNPFSSGNRVFEPGRTIRLSLIYDKLFGD
jgi:iron complex outermembrane receptor protein